MLFMTLFGYLILMLIALAASQKGLSNLFAGWQRKTWESSLDVDFNKMLPRSLFLVLSEASPQKTQMTSLALYNLRVVGKRATLLNMALSNLGAWWVLLMTLLFMNVSAEIWVAVVFVPFLLLRRYSVVRSSFRLLTATAIFLVFAQLLVRHATIMTSMLEGSDILFSLADGRLPSVLAWLAVAIFVTLFLPFEFWSVCVALVLLFSSVISFNVAIALFAGERMGRAILFAWAGRKLNQDCRQISLHEGFAAAGGALAGLFVTLYLRGITDIGRSFGFSDAQSRILDFTLALVLVLFVQFCLQMLVGHFAAQKSVDEIQDIRYFPSSWLRDQRLSAMGAAWARTQATKRIQEIRYHIQGLGTYKEGQIPEQLQSRLKREEEELQHLLKEI